VVLALQALLRDLDARLLAVGRRVAAANQGKVQDIVDAIAKGSKSQELSSTLYKASSEVCAGEPGFAQYMAAVTEAAAHTLAQELDTTQSMGLLQLLSLVPATEVSALAVCRLPAAPCPS